MMNIGVILLGYLAMFFIVLSVMSLGRAMRWFFGPEHFVVLQRIFWGAVVIGIALTVLSCKGCI